MIKKIFELTELVHGIERVRKTGKTIVFTNGCFDILHAGHVDYLAAARSEGDVLIVGVNSDESVKMIKPSNRPIIGQNLRAKALSGLKCVDYIIIFDDPDPFNLICTLKPDVLVKGADWKENDIIGADIVKKNGGKVVRVPLVPGISTSDIIDTILDRYK